MPSYGTGWTVAGAVLLLVLLVLVGYQVARTYPFSRLERPATSVPLFWGRELDAATAAVTSPAWQRYLALASLSSERELLERASKDLQALARLLEGEVVGDAPADADPVRARLAVTLGAAGRFAELDKLSGRHGPELKQTVRAAYGRGPLPAPAVIERARSAFFAPPMQTAGPDWWVNELTARLADRQGDAPAAAASRQAIQQRGQRIVRNAGLLTLFLLVPVYGLGMLLAGLWRRRRPGQPKLLPGPLSSAEVPLPFPGRLGLALLVRGALWGGLLSLVPFIAGRVLHIESTGLAGPLTYLPLIYLLRKPLYAQGKTVAGTLGLWPWPAAGWGRATLILIGVEMLLSVVGGLVVAAADAGGSPSEVLLEGALGHRRDVLLTALEAVIWAPLFEEIVFRGVLHGTLRRRYGAIASAALSAAVFALLHGYSPLVLLPLWGGAFASALVYERTRSLWPCILSHAFNNALVVLGLVTLYR